MEEEKGTKTTGACPRKSKGSSLNMSTARVVKEAAPNPYLALNISELVEMHDLAEEVEKADASLILRRRRKTVQLLRKHHLRQL